MHPNLSFEQAPPISVPFRFFLTAPLFGILAGLLMIWEGPALLESRWSPLTLSATHLITMGFMLQAMAGALMQFVPVAAGGNVWQPRWVAFLCHPTLAFGALSLAAGFVIAPFWFVIAMASVAAGGTMYVTVVLIALITTPATGPTVMALRVALPALAVTLVLGVLLAEGYRQGASWPMLQIADVHAAWGLAGWALVLLVGVSNFVVPMFQLTPPYPSWVSRGLPLAMLPLLLLWSGQLIGMGGAWQQLVFLSALACAGAFAVVTLQLQGRRRRKITDSTFLLFRFAMISLLAIPASELLFMARPDVAADPRAPIWIGVLAIPGVFVTVITGMLYKIVPFIGWLQLQRLAGTGIAPNMRDIIPERSMRLQMRAHFAAVTVLLAAVLLPDLARLAGILLTVSMGWLWWNLRCGAVAFSRIRDRMRSGAPDSGP